MTITIQSTLIKSNVRYFSRYINENLYFSRLFQLVATGCGTKSQTCDVTLPWAADLLGPVHLVMFAALNTQHGETEDVMFFHGAQKPRVSGEHF